MSRVFIVMTLMTVLAGCDIVGSFFADDKDLLEDQSSSKSTTKVVEPESKKPARESASEDVLGEIDEAKQKRDEAERQFQQLSEQREQLQDQLAESESEMQRLQAEVERLEAVNRSDDQP